MEKKEKIYGRTIATYAFLLEITLILKLLGGNYFQASVDNRALNIINDITDFLHLQDVWYLITTYINVYIVASMTTNDNSKRLKIFVTLFIPLIVFVQVLKNTGNELLLFVDFLYLAIIPFIYSRINKEVKYSFKNYLMIVLIVNLLQIASMIIRDGRIEILTDNFIINFIYNFDYLIMLIIIYKYYFMKGSVSIWEMVVSFGSHLLHSLRKLPKKLRAYYLTNSRLSNEEKIEKAVYIPLVILFNLFTLSCILFIAVLNGVMMEAIYITISFWINKKAFGKPYHCETVAKCFVVSSLSYYVLTKVTTELGISLLVPIFLGIALSYITSLFVKEKYEKKLYKGMPEEDFYRIVNMATDNELDIKMLKEYYCDRMTQTAVAMRNNYSISSFEKKKKKILDKLKEV